MIKPLCNVRTHEQFAVIADTENSPECSNRLFKNLTAMSYKQQSNLPLMSFKEALEIESSDHRFASPCGRYHKVACLAVYAPFCF